MAIGRRLAIIPAREGSKRLPTKNYIDFYGKPMIEWVIDSCKESKLFDLIHISTNCKEVLKIASSKKLKPEFTRPKSLCGDNVGLLEVIEYVSNYYKEDNNIFDEIWCILPCNPLLNKEDLISASNFIKNEFTGPPYKLLSVIPYSQPPQWALILNEKKILSPLYRDMMHIRSQDLKETYADSGTFIIFSSDLIYKKESKNFPFKAFQLDPLRFVDIDNMNDLKLLKTLYHLKNQISN